MEYEVIEPDQNRKKKYDMKHFIAIDLSFWIEHNSSPSTSQGVLVTSRRMTADIIYGCFF